MVELVVHMSSYEIPLSTGNQRFSITLNGISYLFTLVWRDAVESGWYLDIANPDNSALVNGIPLTVGNSIIEQYQHKIRGQLRVLTQDGKNPSFDGLGISTKLYWID